jgi:hypothetical protein
MSKLTLGVVAGFTLAAAAAVPALAASGSSHDVLNTGSVGVAQTTVDQTSTVASKAQGVAVKTTGKVTSVATVALPVPAPTKLVPSPDPNSQACRLKPTTLFCSTSSVRYLVAGTTLSAHDKWKPVLTKWGLTDITDTCVKTSATADTVCAIQGTHGSLSVAVLFKAVYDGQYAPAAVKAQTTAIHAKAIADALKAKTPAAQAKILQAANNKIAALEKAADAYNASHPKSSVNVVTS